MPISATLTGCVVTHPEKWTASWARPASRRPQRKIRTVCAAIVRATLFTFLGSKALNTGLIGVLRFVLGDAGGKVINQLLPICIDGFSSIVIVAVQLVLSQLAPACGLIGRDFTDLNALVFSELDRKSTRLNSSHVAISYAVFCLKKKNINNIKR